MATKPVQKLIIIASIVVVLLAIGFVLLWCFADRLFYYPDARVYGTPADYGVTAEDVTFAAPGGPQLHGWWLPAVGESRGTVVYCHGNAANVTLHARYVTWLPARGYSVLVFDYRGYGKSLGRASRDGTVADAVAALDYALAKDAQRTVVFGHSLGGAVAIAAAAERPAVRAVVAESTFPSYLAIAKASAPMVARFAPLFVLAGQDPVAVLDRLPPRPLMVIHGDADPIVPVQLGRDLFAQASEPKELWIVPGADHFSAWVKVPVEFEQRVDAFFSLAIEGR